MSSWSPLARAAKGMFGFFSSEPTKENKYAIEQAIKAMDESPGNKTILDIETKAAQKTAEKAKLNRKLTNLLNGKRNSTRLRGERSVPITKAAAAVVKPKAAAADKAAAVATPKTPAAATVNLKAGPGKSIDKSIDKSQVNESKADDKVKTTSTDAAHATMDAINANLALDNELSKEKPSDELNAEILKKENELAMKQLYESMKASMQSFIAAQKDITEFRKKCVDEAVKQFQEALSVLRPDKQISPEMSGTIMRQIAESWSEFLISPTQGDSSVYLSYKTFFFRVNQAIDALLTQCIFLSTKWTHSFPPRPSLSLLLSDLSSRKVNVGPCFYVVGPILDFQNIEGRIFIYVKCYKTQECTDGIYFWVYGSQSEGFNRVFFKLDPFGSIEKGFDYTQGTFVHLRLQMALCDYYKTHRSKPPELLDTLTKLNFFMSSMPYLQQDSRTNGYHRYMIDDSFTSIIKRGFPLHPPLPNPTTIHSDWLHVVNMIYKKRGYVSRENLLKIAGELQEQWDDREYGRKLFPTDVKDETNQFYDFSRIQMGYGTTCPYIFCFTTCGLTQSCPMFKLFLSANSYKNTFWCQGFQNYTEMLLKAELLEGYAPPNRKILSPVLHVVMGALLQKPDMAMSSLRSNMLNIGITSDGELHKDQGSTIRIPVIDFFRKATIDAYEKMQLLSHDKSSQSPFRKSSIKQVKYDASLDAIIEKMVTEKIIMIECLANLYILYMPDPTDHTKYMPPPTVDTKSFVDEVNRLLDPYKLALLPRIKFASDNTRVTTDHALAPEYATKQKEAIDFIEASPEAAAAALFGYISSPKKHENEPTDFVKELTDLAHLCLKKEWSDRMIDYEYYALEGVFNPRDARYRYFGTDGEFHQFDPPPPPPPAAAPVAPYVLISSFDEVRKEDTSPTNPVPKELNVTVVTFAHIYRVDCSYTEVSSYTTRTPKSMSIIYQISTTIVYTREETPKILYAMNQKTPILCSPGLLEAEAAEAEAKSLEDKLLTSPHTLLATYNRVMSNGAFYAGKMMEYFFGGDRGYYQLPYFFRHFDKFLKVCHQYDSTVLMYLPEISPYNLLRHLPNAQPLLYASIQPYFTELGITFHSIGTKLEKNTKDIQAIFKYLTEDLMVEPDTLDDVSMVSDSQGTTSSGSSTSSTSSRFSGIVDFLLFDDFSSQDTSPPFNPSQVLDDSMDSGKGGTLPIKYHIKKSITTRKNKNKNKPRTKSKTPARRITIRIKRLIKSKVTKPKTYKRRATGGKRKSKPNKTMRRYRRVRK